MNFNDYIGKVLTILQVVECVIGIYVVVVSENKVLVGGLVILGFIVVTLLYVLYSKELYIRFIEYLFENEHHKFELLPEMRMYLHIKKIENKVKYNSIDITYDIKHKKSDKSRLLGDVDITYKLDIKNENLPQSYSFITGNDYSNKPPILLYKYGTMEKHTSISADKVNCAIYKRNAIRHFEFEFDKNEITGQDNLEVEMKISYEDSFEFEHVPMDTIICLPKIFGNSIPKIKYTINLIDFPEEDTYYMFSYIVRRKNLEYVRNTIQNTNDSNRRTFVVELSPNKVIGEKAYYFRLGTINRDEENCF